MDYITRYFSQPGLKWQVSTGTPAKMPQLFRDHHLYPTGDVFLANDKRSGEEIEYSNGRMLNLVL
ncbi:hypothetical protein V6Z11_D12G063200 [Gossypium hirsutum]